MALLDRHVNNKGYTLSIVRDRKFSPSKEASIRGGKRNALEERKTRR